MKMSVLWPLLGLIATAAHAADDPTVFGPGVISGPANEASPVFTPDGDTVYFTRSNSSDNVILVAQRAGKGWSQPKIAPFSGQWRDLEAAMAPDGSYMIFASSRPVPETGKQPDGFWGGTVHVGRGGNLWRVDRTKEGWSEPKHLSAVVNRNGSTFGPSVAANGDLYFTDMDDGSKHSHLYYAAYKDGGYATPQPMPFTDPRWSDVDEAVAPDEAFMVFCSNRPPTPAQQLDLFIVFRKGGNWGEPQHLPDSINHQGGIIEARLSPDTRTLYFTSGYEVPVSYPKDATSAARSLQDMDWNNGSYNIWQVDISALLPPKS
jgi:Tol biopolymer transport system component